MRLVATQMITLDGRIEFLGDWFDPASPDPDLEALQDEQTAEEQILLLGRQTFEDFRGFWPAAAEDGSATGKHLNQVAKRVVSSTIKDPQWENTEVIAADPIAAIRNMKNAPGGVIGVTGSIQLTHALLNARLVDELRLFIYPIVQGAGRSLFEDDSVKFKLELNETRHFSSGVIYASYQISD